MSERNHPLQTSLGETRADIEDVWKMSETQLEQLGSNGTELIEQLEELSFKLAMLAEEVSGSTRYCF